MGFFLRLVLALCWLNMLVGCSMSDVKNNIPKPLDFPNSNGHLKSPPELIPAKGIPKPLTLPVLPEPVDIIEEQRHTVVVNDVPIRELMFSLARDAKLNLDIASDVEGTITINAVNQTLLAILERITTDADLVYEIKNDVLRVRKDRPYLRSYRVDYLNIARNSQGLVSVSTEIASTGQGASTDGGGEGGGAGNSSETEVSTVSQNSFWETLENNIEMILTSSELEDADPEADEEEGAESQSETTSNSNIVLNKEAGVIAVRAKKKQHIEIQRFIDEVQFSTRRQVLIEATIAEVKLSDTYQAGIDWSFVKQGDQSASIFQNVTNLGLFDRPGFSITLSDLDFGGNPLEGTLRALENFGDVRVMSSPKIMALNNQTALLKVVDNLVYFTIEVNIENTESSSLVTYETDVNTVPVGFVMSVTPYINEHGSVTLNVRPTISRVIEYVNDPNPQLAEVNVVSQVPVIQVREMESVLKVASGDIAVIGGLMQDEIEDRHEGVPILSKLPWVGKAFRYDNDSKIKTELVIFIKPLVVNHASLNGDLREYKQYLQ